MMLGDNENETQIPLTRAVCEALPHWPDGNSLRHHQRMQPTSSGITRVLALQSADLAYLDRLSNLSGLHFLI